MTSVAQEASSVNEKMEHTPGEWYVFDSGERANPIIEVRSSKEPVVFWSGFDRSEVPAKRRRANSRLISAAPDLLQALNDCMAEIFSECEARGIRVLPECYEKARVAIAKARSGAHRWRRC